MKTLVFFFVTIALIGFGNYLKGGHVNSLFHFNTFLIVLAPVLAYLIYANGIKGLGPFFQRVTSGEIKEGDTDIVHNSITIGLLTGILGTVLGFIHVFNNLTEPAHLGQGVATILVSIMYGTLPALFFVPLSRGQTKQQLFKVSAYIIIAIPSTFGMYFMVLKAIGV